MLAAAAFPAPSDRLDGLRGQLRLSGLDGFILPRADAHQGEYLPPGAERLEWLTGFNGSAGLAVVLMDAAAIFVDGRYTLQVHDQVDTARIQPQHLTDTPPGEWIPGHVGRGAKLGYDPWLHPIPWVERLRKRLDKHGIELVAVDANPIDALWPDRPPAPAAPVVPHPDALAGRAAAEKRALIAEDLAQADCDAVVLNTGESIAWLLNIRGGDVPYTPLALGFLILVSDGSARLFIDPAKVDDTVRAHLGDRVTVEPVAAFEPALAGLGTAKRAVSLDPHTACAWIHHRLSQAGAKIVQRADPCALPRARKTEAELAGARAAHRRDGAALVRFLAWLDGRLDAGETVSELQAVDALRASRARHPDFRGDSFPTIAGAGPNGAIVHYRVTAQTDRPLAPGGLFLLDSGGQYPDGTTDVTRTIAVGGATAQMRRQATLVLKGHIALSRARFPKGTTGSQLDVLARQFLWADGLDYDHGTGHGVGSYLGVHEGPQRIAKTASTVALEPGMILSNEPGYYRPGHYGIRIENLVVVRPVADLVPDPQDPAAAGGYFGFETLTLVPFCRHLIDPDLLTAAERAWIDTYHARVLAELANQDLTDTDRHWLQTACAPL